MPRLSEALFIFSKSLLEDALDPPIMQMLPLVLIFAPAVIPSRSKRLSSMIAGDRDVSSLRASVLDVLSFFLGKASILASSAGSIFAIFERDDAGVIAFPFLWTVSIYRRQEKKRQEVMKGNWKK